MQKYLFEPKLGRPCSRDASNNKTVSNRLIRESTKGLSRGPRMRGPLTRRPVAELARGKGVVFALREPRAGSRRVLIKARIARHTTTDLGAARAHQHYILRDGVTRDGSPGCLYGRELDDVDGGAFLDRQKKDTYQFRLIISPEDSAQMADVKPFVQDLMRQMERDLDTQLDWVAVVSRYIWAFFIDRQFSLRSKSEGVRMNSTMPASIHGSIDL